MYEVNDTFVYGTNGICKIIRIEERKFEGKLQKYYVLKPIYEKYTIYLPVDNEAAMKKMRHVLTEEQIYSLIRDMPDEGTIWIENDTERKAKYRQILAGNDRRALINLIKTLYLRQQKQEERGRKLHVADERFMKEAEKMLYDEFAHVLNINREQVLPFIVEQLEVGQNQGEEGKVAGLQG